jgi:hypothetical protein
VRRHGNVWAPAKPGRARAYGFFPKQ